MGRTKFAVDDVQAFDNAMLAACDTDEERAVVYILALTGMHISSLLNLKPSDVVRRGPDVLLTWERPKTRKRMEHAVPKGRIALVEAFAGRIRRRPSTDAYNFILKRIGRKAGYPDVSPMTFRHNYCRRLIDAGGSLLTIPTEMGCSEQVAVRNYARQQRAMRKDDYDPGQSSQSI